VATLSPLVKLVSKILVLSTISGVLWVFFNRFINVII
ncbi:hypothetical protein LCGC14_3113190, partial [marine sediment metagenome]